MQICEHEIGDTLRYHYSISFNRNIWKRYHFDFTVHKNKFPGSRSTKLKLKILTLSDFLYLLFAAFNITIEVSCRVDLEFGRYLQPMILPFTLISIAFIPYSVSAWTIMFIAIERVVAIVKPFLVKIVFTFNFVRNMSLSWIFITSSICVLKACEFKLVYDDEKKKITKERSVIGNIPNVMAAINVTMVVLYFTIPMLVTLVCNIVFVVSLLQNRRTIISVIPDAQRRGKKDSKISRMIIFLSVVFFLTTSPSAVLRSYALITDDRHSDGIQLGFNVTFSILYSNYSINWLIYLVSVPEYRKNFIALFHLSYDKIGIMREIVMLFHLHIEVRSLKRFNTLLQ